VVVDGIVILFVGFERGERLLVGVDVELAVA